MGLKRFNKIKAELTAAKTKLKKERDDDVKEELSTEIEGLEEAFEAVSEELAEKKEPFKNIVLVFKSVVRGLNDIMNNYVRKEDFKQIEQNLKCYDNLYASDIAPYVQQIGKMRKQDRSSAIASAPATAEAV